MAYGVNESPFKYSHITASGATTVKSFPGILHTIVVNQPGTTNTITVSDAGGTIAAITGTIGTFIYDVGFTSLTVNPSATCDLTIAYS